MARKGSKKAKEAAAKEEHIKSLADAIRFVLPAQSEEGSPLETHSRLANKTIIAFNGVIAMGAFIPDDIFACPNTFALIHALERCKEPPAFMVAENGQSVRISSGRFQVHLPLFDPNAIQPAWPTMAAVQGDLDIVRNALQTVGVFARDKSEHVVTASVLLRENTAVGTDRMSIVEAWHGISLPNLCIPKQSIAVLAKIKKKLTGIGWEQNSCTFWFEDQSWFRTQLYPGDWPNVDRILNSTFTPWPVPDGFVEGLEALEPFTDDNDRIFMCGDHMRTTKEDLPSGARFSVAGVPNGVIFGAARLLDLAPYMHQIDLQWNASGGPGCFFTGQTFEDVKVRGAIMGIKDV